jgi:RNA polymerase sigma-70 factor (ECF subfamily)
MEQGQTTFKRELLAVLPSLRAFAISLIGRHDRPTTWCRTPS